VIRRAGLGAGFAVFALAVAAAQSQVPPLGRAERGEQFVPRPELARVAALGFHSLLADGYWLLTVQLVGDDHADATAQGPLIGRLVDVVTTLDPWVDHPYRFAAVSLVHSEAEVRMALRLLERAVQYHPLDWRNFFYLGYGHFYFLEENERAATWLERAAALPGSPSYLPRLVARLRSTAGGGLDAAEMFLRQLVDDAQDEFARAQYLRALDEIETERRARLLDAAREEYRRRHGHDIGAVADLARGSPPVLPALPPEPHGWAWELDAEGRIVSSYYGRRYEVSISEVERRKRDEWRRQREERRDAA
jgi:hypothetical protein